jgi:hypothetical protein
VQVGQHCAMMDICAGVRPGAVPHAAQRNQALGPRGTRATVSHTPASHIALVALSLPIRLRSPIPTAFARNRTTDPTLIASMPELTTDSAATATHQQVSRTHSPQILSTSSPPAFPFRNGHCFHFFISFKSFYTAFKKKLKLLPFLGKL